MGIFNLRFGINELLFLKVVAFKVSIDLMTNDLMTIYLITPVSNKASITPPTIMR